MGVYLVIKVTKSGVPTEPSGDQGKGGGEFVVLGGDGEEYESSGFSLDIGGIAEGSGKEAPDAFTSTGIFDVPASATAGARLQIEDAGTKYTIDLGL